MVAQILVVMIAAIIVTIVAERRNIQPPLLLAAVGVAASLIPGLDRFELEPEIILTVVLPPLLFSAATEFSFVSFLKRLGSIVNLGVYLVAVTTGIVGAVGFGLAPELTIAAALVMGAVVSPPDAVTAVAVGRKLNLPGRMMTVLKGESLINDAAALTLFTFAAASVVGTKPFISNLFLYLLYASIAGFVIGLIVGAIVHQTRLRLRSASLATALSVLVPFAAYLVAEEVGASGVLAVVAAGLSLGHNSREAGYEERIQERQFWRTADALLEAFVFAYIGLQFRFVIAEVMEGGYELLEVIGISFAILLLVIVVRIAWVFATGVLSRWRSRRIAARLAHPEMQKRLKALEQRGGRFEQIAPFTWRENLVIGWTGMRGVVTLAAAAGIPLVTATGDPFPGRDLIQAVAFVVTIGTLLIQGLTLPWLIRRLGISDPHEAEEREKQHAIAEVVAREAAVATITAFRNKQTDPLLRQRAEGMVARMNAPTPNDEGTLEGRSEMLDLAREMTAARRAAVVKARDERRLDDEVMREVLEQIDFEQATMAGWTPERAGGR